MNDLHKRFIYYPVDPRVNRKALELSQAYLSNPLWPLPTEYLDFVQRKTVLCDSAGLQLLKLINKGKRPLVGPMLKTKRRKNGVLTIGTVSNCMEYARLGSKIAFLIDFPSREDDSDSVFYWKLGESIRARNHMLKIINYISPYTKPAIALQPRNPLEVAKYFGLISTPSVRIYGYPARSPSDYLGNAYVLSFLHHAGVRHVHFLGSSAASIIYLLAQALALEMFDEASFDSFTWNRRKWGIRLISPETLSNIPGRKKGRLHPKGNLYWVLRKFPDFLAHVQDRFNLQDVIIIEEWLGICNITAIDYFKDRALDAALRRDLPAHVRTYNPRILRIVEALNLLHESKVHGHDYVDRKYRARIEQKYMGE